MCGCMVNGVAHGPHARHHGLPAPHAALQGRRRAVPRAVARQGVPGDQGSGGGPRRVRPHHRRRRLSSRSSTGSAPGRQRHPGPEGELPTAPWMRRPASAAARASPLCPNASAALFTGAKIAHLGLLPQGQPEREQRAIAMVAQAKQELFGSCTNIGECEAVCPKEIKLEVIARMNRDFLRASWTGREALARRRRRSRQEAPGRDPPLAHQLLQIQQMLRAGRPSSTIGTSATNSTPDEVSDLAVNAIPDRCP